MLLTSDWAVESNRIEESNQSSINQSIISINHHSSSIVTKIHRSNTRNFLRPKFPFPVWAWATRFWLKFCVYCAFTLPFDHVKCRQWVFFWILGNKGVFVWYVRLTMYRTRAHCLLSEIIIICHLCWNTSRDCQNRRNKAPTQNGHNLIPINKTQRSNKNKISTMKVGTVATIAAILPALVSSFVVQPRTR